MTLRRIISGGQTGADRAGLEAGAILGLQTGGSAPYGFMTEDGPCPALGITFGLVAMPQERCMSTMYIKRTKTNVDDADGTVVFRFKKSLGTDKTIGYACTGQWIVQRHVVPRTPPYSKVHVVRSFVHYDKELQEFREWLQREHIGTLNVAGHRASCAPTADFQFRVCSFLVEAIRPLLSPPSPLSIVVDE